MRSLVSLLFNFPNATIFLVSTTIYFVRHGSAENPENIVYGRMPGFHLSESGKKNAAKLADYFADKPIKAIYTSPLERNFETANIIASSLSKGVPVSHLYELIEVDAIGWQGLAWDETFKNDTYERFISNASAPVPGENLSQIAKRMVGVTIELAKKHAGEEIICVSHEFPILVLKLKLQNKRLETMRNLDLPTGGIVKFVFDDKLNLEEADNIELQ